LVGQAVSPVDSFPDPVATMADSIRINTRLAVGDNERMVKSVEGICRNGKVELSEPLAEAEGSRVIVTGPSRRPR
jgi:hypothetical protein